MSRSRRLAPALIAAVLLAGCSGAGTVSAPTGPAAPLTSSAADTRSGSPSAAASSPEVSAPAVPATTAPVASAASSTVSAPPVAAAAEPNALVTAEDITAAAELVAGLTDRELAGSVIMANSAHAVGTGLVADLGLGGVILMGNRGIIDGTEDGAPHQIAAVTEALQAQSPEVGLLIATDQEFGTVQRLRAGFTDLPAANEYATAGENAAELVAAAARVAGREMRAVGITVNFAPDADLLPHPAAAYDGSSAIGTRSYGSDPVQVGDLVAAAVSGYAEVGVAATVKHFPGIGAITADTHTDLPVTDKDCPTWNDTDAVPFRAAVRAGAPLVMTGHVLFPAAGETERPASLSPGLVDGLLRGADVSGCTGLGFTGIAVTDALEMAPISGPYDSGTAAVLALQAGQDLLLMPVDPAAAVEGIVTAVSDGSLDRNRLVQAATRVFALRIAQSRLPSVDPDVINGPEHRAEATRIEAALGY